MSPKRIAQIRAKIKAWRAIAIENDPMDAMLNVMEELVGAVEKGKAK